MASKKPTTTPEVPPRGASGLGTSARSIDPASLPPELLAELEEDIRRVSKGLDPAGVPLIPNESVDPPEHS